MNIRQINEIEARGVSELTVVRIGRIVTVERPNNKIVFRVVIATEPVKAGGVGYHASCLNFPDMSLYADTEEEAISIAVNAAKLYLQAMIENNDPIPIGSAVI